MKQLFKKLIVSILTLEAKLVLRRYKPRIVAITGSVGKTSSKDAIVAALSTQFSVRKSTKSYNSEVGVPLTILGLSSAWSSPFGWIMNIVKGFGIALLPGSYPQWLVLEVGADHPGDIKRITRFVRPEIVVVTRFAKVPVHLEFFSSREELIAEKAQLVKALQKDGTLVLNYDDEEVADLSRLFQGDTLFYGFHTHAHVYGSNDVVEYKPYKMFEMPSGLSVKVNYNGSSVPVVLPGCIGRQHIYPVLAAFTVGITLDMNMISISEALSGYTTPPGRMRILPGIKKTMIIDDSYNSSPVAAYEALNVLRDTRVPYRRVVVLGDMKELGEASKAAHQDLGKHAAEVCDLLLTVGELAHDIAEGALRSGMPDNMVAEFEDAGQAGEALEHWIEPGDVILIKGSQAVRCERTVEEVMAEPERAGELLARQEPEWKGDRRFARIASSRG